MTLNRLRTAAVFVLVNAAAALGQPAVPLTVDQAVARALEVSHRLAETQAREVAAQAAVRTQETAKQPTLTVSGGYTRTRHVEPFGVRQPSGFLSIIYPDIPDNYFTHALFQWPIYTAGRLDALERAAEAEVRASAAEVETTRADLRLEVVRVYWALATAVEAERVMREAVDRADAHVRDVRSRFDTGLVPPNEVSSAEAQRSRQQLQLIEAQNARRSVLEDLRRLTGIAGEIELTDRFASIAPQPAGPAIVAGADRPERQALLERILATEQRRRAIEAGRRPTVAVNGAFDYSNPNPRIFPRRDVWRGWWEAGVTASWTLWDGGRIAAEAAETVAAEAVLRARLAETDSLITLDVKQRLLDVDSARASLTAAADGVRSAAEARRVVDERYNVGVATNTEVLDAQLALLEAELDRTRALASIKLAEARLERALGR